MNKLQPLVIGDLTVKKPIIQGGMGVGISLSSLAGAVAKAGGIGIISTAQIGFREEDFAKHPQEANLRAVGKELRRAREIAPDGVLGFNIMVATRDYELYVKEAVKAGADIIISGAGLPVDLPAYAEGSSTKLAPIVSSAKSARVICRLWDRKYKRVPDLVVIEGPLAGGHLGFSREELHDYCADTEDVPSTYKREVYEAEIKKIMDVVKEFGEKYKTKIPVVIAGGIYDHQDVIHHIEDLGADGVQVATRFVTTEECDAPMAYKEAYIAAEKEDIVITKSPVGMPGRAIRNQFLSQVSDTPAKIDWCYQCLEHCNPAQIPYCITKALVNAAIGKEDEALLFCGSNAYRATKIETVPEVMAELCGE
ncbi:nitronate monooxygenase family protein [Clostridium sp. AM58-1XD]|uniref:NAD(P)H-dependent flavin oxidoreductase n=1 Tax=Clostridium sp. AM58-1XD TaxID=2292307 RepID=UPI000E5558FD|nr:nitronate monooxygenase family protein [Clostridium sp. AM58-1XD]RGZ01164.1 nitronate monooxygenase [Clostridium sp. AM58-1XD]